MTNGRNSRLAAALVVGLSMLAPAVAMAEGEGNGPMYPGLHSPDVVIGSASAASATDVYTSRQNGVRGVTLGSTVPSTSNSEGEPEPVNSLPAGSYAGMLGAPQQAVQQ